MNRIKLRKKVIILIIFLAFLMLCPINSTIIRLLIITSIVLLMASISYFFYIIRKIIFYLWIILLIAVIIFLVLPGIKINEAILRNKYTQQLKKYENTLYLWGGENRIGIDCSGLIRKALIMTYFKIGLTRINPLYIRKSIDLWWYDCSARSLRDSYRNQTKKISYSSSINSLNHSLLLPGDLAVTKDGIHILAYLGNLEWIEADPDYYKVLRLKIPNDNYWFNKEVYLLRWEDLD